MAIIMVVDDEEDTRKSVITILETEGYKMMEASNGNECLKRIKKKQPDLILLDVMMPGMAAKDVIKEINKSEVLKKIKIIFFTAVSTSDEEREKMKKLGHIVDYIGKPFEMNEMITKIKKALV